MPVRSPGRSQAAFRDDAAEYADARRRRRLKCYARRDSGPPGEGHAAAGRFGHRVIDRRTFLSTLAGGLLAAPVAAKAQQAGQVHRIGSLFPEPEFLNALCRRTGCGLLCDVSNVYVTAHNLGLYPGAFLQTLRPAMVGEIHLAGHVHNEADGQTILLDDHGSRVAPAVWQLFAQALAHLGRKPTLIEWDTDIPALEVLLDEAHTADRFLAEEPPEHGRADAA